METVLIMEVAKLILGAYFEQMKIAGKTKEEVRQHFLEIHEAYAGLDPAKIPDPS